MTCILSPVEFSNKLFKFPVLTSFGTFVDVEKLYFFLPWIGFQVLLCFCVLWFLSVFGNESFNFCSEFVSHCLCIICNHLQIASSVLWMLIEVYYFGLGLSFLICCSTWNDLSFGFLRKRKVSQKMDSLSQLMKRMLGIQVMDLIHLRLVHSSILCCLQILDMIQTQRSKMAIKKRRAMHHLTLE